MERSGYLFLRFLRNNPVASNFKQCFYLPLVVVVMRSRSPIHMEFPRKQLANPLRKKTEYYATLNELNQKVNDDAYMKRTCRRNELAGMRLHI